MQLSSSLAVSQNSRCMFRPPALIPEPSLCIQLPPPLGTAIPFLWNHFFFHVTFESLWCLLFCVSLIITAYIPFLIDVGNGRHKRPPWQWEGRREKDATRPWFGFWRAIAGLRTPLSSVIHHFSGFDKGSKKPGISLHAEALETDKGLMWASVHQELTGLGPWLEARQTGKYVMVSFSVSHVCSRTFSTPWLRSWLFLWPLNTLPCEMPWMYLKHQLPLPLLRLQYMFMKTPLLARHLLITY